MKESKKHKKPKKEINNERSQEKNRQSKKER